MPGGGGRCAKNVRNLGMHHWVLENAFGDVKRLAAYNALSSCYRTGD